MNVALPVVVAAAVAELEGAVAAGVLDELGAVVEGDVDCASALVNANPLTAAMAMMFLSMVASWALVKGIPGSPAQAGFLEQATREPGPCSRYAKQSDAIHDFAKRLRRLLNRLRDLCNELLLH